MMTRGAIMWFLLLLLMPVMLSNACPSESFSPANSTRWELLEAVADQIHIEDGLMIRTKESYRYYFWDLYKSVPRSQRLEIVNKMSESLKEVAFRDRRFDMVGLILFGPDKGRSFLRIRHDKRPEPVNVLGYIQCVRTLVCSTSYNDDLFEKHCGPSCFRGLRHTRSRANLCSLATKEAIEEAMILACGMNFIEPEPQQQVPYGYLAFGSGLHVLEVTAIFLSSPSAMVAVASCLALNYVISSIITPMLFKKKELPWENFTDGWTRDQVAKWVSCPGFKEWMIKNYHRIIILPDTSHDE
ncbi:uncharacterized protein LOC110873423 isoform X3 [Helianthus annuus]|nr:uncharacterized protein LOC110873423 isoform X3 [Helianthus annuus]